MLQAGKRRENWDGKRLFFVKSYQIFMESEFADFKCSKNRTLTLRVNNLQMIAAQVKALQVVDCNVLLRTSCH